MAFKGFSYFEDFRFRTHADLDNGNPMDRSACHSMNKIILEFTEMLSLMSLYIFPNLIINTVITLAKFLAGTRGHQANSEHVKGNCSRF